MSTIWERNRAAIEEYGIVFVGTGLALFAIEMVVLVGLLSNGVDFAPFLGWVQSTFGVDASGVLDNAGAVFVAYAISRVLKPLHIVVTLALTPIVARYTTHKEEEQAAGRDEGR